jgi:hypothetical protein
MSRTFTRESNLSKPLQRQLNAYTLAASAAGVGMLSLAQTADAKIIYTKSHIQITSPGTYCLDLNHDGTKDFKLVNSYDTASAFLDVAGLNRNNRLWGDIGRGGFYFASALKAGAEVGPNTVHFSSNAADYHIMAKYNAVSHTSTGQWVEVSNRYLGLRVEIKGKVHYGWARLSVRSTNGLPPPVATLTGYAYETIPNKPIITGKTEGPDVITLEPGSLGQLAQGSAGCSGK